MGHKIPQKKLSRIWESFPHNPVQDQHPHKEVQSDNQSLLGQFLNEEDTVNFNQKDGKFLMIISKPYLFDAYITTLLNIAQSLGLYMHLYNN